MKKALHRANLEAGLKNTVIFSLDMCKTKIFTLIFVLSSAVAYSQDYRIAPEVQSQRDDLRMAILKNELVKESKLLSDAEMKYNALVRSGGNAASLNEAREDIDNHKSNIDALRKEIKGKGSYSPRSRTAKRKYYVKDSPVMVRLGGEDTQKKEDLDWWDVYER